MIRVAVIQMVSTDEVDINLENAADLIQQAVADHAEFLVLPENFPFMGQEEHDKISIKESPGTGPIQDFLKDQASQHGIWLMGGTIPLQASVPDKIRAACLLYNPEGECVSRYDKMHLFDVTVDSGGDESYKESGTIEAGNQIVVFKTPFASIGMSVCYDLRFPELYRVMHTQHVNMITVPSAFTATTGKAHWESLLRARAIENLCYVVASNQGGKHINQRVTWGHSLILDPWGETLAVINEGPGIACANVDIDKLEEIRHTFPALEHRKI